MQIFALAGMVCGTAAIVSDHAVIGAVIVFLPMVMNTLAMAIPNAEKDQEKK